jgi:hypothetical protein
MVDKIIKSLHRHNWKYPGFDKLQNFWIKQLSVMHNLTRAINDMIKDPKNIPTWLTSGIVFLFSKRKDKKDPRNYCLNTCLPKIYKILTAAMTNMIYNHLIRKTFSQKNRKADAEGLRDLKISCW